MIPHEFVRKWQNNQSTERQAYQQYFLDLCELVGHAKPKEYDPESKVFTFEAGTTKSSGGQGWADVWLKGRFAIEFKGPDGNLEKAYKQLLDYRESLDNPPLLVVSDTQTIVIHTNFTNSPKSVRTLRLADVETPEGLQMVRNLFYNVEAFRPEKTTEQVTTEAAAEFAKLADYLRKWDLYTPHAIAHYLIRLLFILFAEDIDLLPHELFTRLVERGRRDPAVFNRQMRQLFHAMAEGDVFGEQAIRWFNGGLFDDAAVIDLDEVGLKILHDVTQMDWAAMEPSIMGTVFVRSLDPSKRAQLGAQYTSKEDILLIVEPVLMEPLRREWAEVQEQVRALATKRDAATTIAARTRVTAEMQGRVIGFAERIRGTRVLDPACGSGNFLYVSLRLLLELEKEVSHFCGTVGLQPFFVQVSPAQLYGIEVNEYAHELAQTTVWIGYLQWHHDNAQGVPSEPILQMLDNIRQMDAILGFDGEGKAVEPEWPAVDVIVGNPPFLGNKAMIAELGETYVTHLRSAYDSRLSGSVDLVVYWFEKSRGAISSHRAKRAGLLATQAIRFGANRAVLERIKESGDIFYAQADRPWVLDGASVRVSMVGFDDGTEVTRLLGSNKEAVVLAPLAGATQVGAINSDLTTAIDINLANRLPENVAICFQGTIKVGPFELDRGRAAEMLDDDRNPSGHSNREVVKPWINGEDVADRNRGLWIIDFGTSMSLSEASQYVAPFEHVKKFVYPQRALVRREGHRRHWWIHGESRPGMRRALAGHERYVVTPRVAKHRLFVWAGVETIPDARLFVFARSDDYFFGVLHCRIHEVWSLRTASRHGVGNDPTYNNSTCFETFPFPWPPGKEPIGTPMVEAIAEAARDLVAQRDAWLNPPGLSEGELKKRTLTNLYNERPAWLAEAHARLDAAVFAAYGWPAGLSDEEILERLLELNLRR